MSREIGVAMVLWAGVGREGAREGGASRVECTF